MSISVPLAKLLELPEIRAVPSSQETAVRGVTADSREVGPGVVFFAVRGAAADGHAFVDEALKRGAAAVIGEEARPGKGATPGYFAVPDSRAALAAAAALFHGYPARKLRCFGVTGTSGKTTSAFLLESILREAGLEPGLIGTVETRYKGKATEATHTTPGPVELQKLLAGMASAGCRSLSMEVSSHALKQSRARGIEFEGAVFTNLTREHLDYHPDMEDYFGSKALLFTRSLKPQGGAAAIGCVTGEEGAYGLRLAAQLAGAMPGLKVMAFGLRETLAQLPASVARVELDGLRVSLEGIRGELRVGGDAIRIESGLVAPFNAFNIAGAVCAARGAGIPVDAIERGISAMKGVPGRLERVPSAAGIHVLVDYAHKPDALATVLRNFQAGRAAGHRLITVFGCGGDRDRTKRPVMGRLAEELSDRVFVTSDNPRTEDPRAIIQEILAGMKGANHAVDPDRRQAIHAAIREARPGDVVIIAGKGHETYQILGKQKVHFDDREVAREFLTLVSRNQ